MVQNKRDLGGLKTADGKMIKPDCLIRSAHLCQATENDLMGIATVIDLRTPGERDQAPDRVWQREYLPLPAFTDEQGDSPRTNLNCRNKSLNEKTPSRRMRR